MIVTQQYDEDELLEDLLRISRTPLASNPESEPGFEARTPHTRLIYSNYYYSSLCVLVGDVATVK